ncbi:hypothetical protein CsSME_00052797 [Camellia sinensis var. sinensis]
MIRLPIHSVYLSSSSLSWWPIQFFHPKPPIGYPRGRLGLGVELENYISWTTCHLSSDHLRMLVRSGHLGNFPIDDISECHGYKMAKMYALPFNKRYDINQKGYRCYDPATKKLYVSRHVTFLEKLPYYTIPSTPVPLTKDELVHVDPFPQDISSDEFVSNIEVSILPLTSTSDISPTPSPAPASPAPLLVYQRSKTLSSLPVSSSTVPPTVSLDPAPPAHRFPKRDRHPPN